MADISEPFVVPLDVKCLEAGCNCSREGVTGHMLKGGGYSTSEKECPECHHPNERHTFTGETKSDYEKKYRDKPI
jgi:hypothetical protein